MARTAFEVAAVHKLLIISLGLLSAAPAQADLQVFACEPEWKALAEEIGGELVSAESATM